MRFLWLLLFLALSFSHGVWMAARLREESRKLDARDDVRRLSKVTLQFFKSGTPPSGDVFWKTIGRSEPLRDPWGLAYELDSPGPHEFRWASAGPDQKLRTSDDIFSRVPFGDGMGIDFTQPHLEGDQAPLSKDAI